MMEGCAYTYEIVEGKEYEYCDTLATQYLYGIPVCDTHGDETVGVPILAYPVSNLSVIHHDGLNALHGEV